MHREKIRQFILDKFPLAKSRGLDDASDLLSDGVLDSLGILELVEYLQAELGVAVDDEDLVPEHFSSVDAIVALVETKTSARA